MGVFIPITEGQALKIAGSEEKLSEVKRQILRGEEVALCTYAKLHRNKGQFSIYGYCWDGSDARSIIAEVDRGSRCLLQGQRPFYIGGTPLAQAA